MRIVENALSISPLFFLFFSLPPPRPPRLSGAIFVFLSDVASSPLVYFEEMRFSSFFYFEPHTLQSIKKVCFVSDARK